jgi:hypothetical protein
VEIPQGPRTETVVRTYGADGALTQETTTIVVTVTPEDTRPEPGCYP